MLEKFVIGMCTMSWKKFKDDFKVHGFKITCKERFKDKWWYIFSKESINLRFK